MMKRTLFAAAVATLAACGSSEFEGTPYGEPLTLTEITPVSAILEAPPIYWNVKAHVAALLGEKAQAIDALRGGAERRFIFVQGTVCARDFYGLHDEPAWQALMTLLGRNPDGSQAVSFDLPPLPGFREGMHTRLSSADTTRAVEPASQATE